MEGIYWTDRVANEEVFGRVGEKSKVFDISKGRREKKMGHCVRQTRGNLLKGLVSRSGIEDEG